MFEIKVNTSPLEGTVLNKRDSMSLLYNGEELSSFTYADNSKQTTKLIKEKVEQIYPFIRVSLWDGTHGFSGMTLETPNGVTTKHTLTSEMEKMDLSIYDSKFDERFEKVRDFLERLNTAIVAFVYTLTHTQESIAKEIQQIENKLDFLKSLLLSSLVSSSV